MQRALRNTLRTENWRENWDNELISPLFENITTRAQPHQFTRAERTTEETSHNSMGHRTQVPPDIRATANSSVMNTCHFTRTDPHRGVSCMAGILIGLNKEKKRMKKKGRTIEKSEKKEKKENNKMKNIKK